jgi:hypothetical protein
VIAKHYHLFAIGVIDISQVVKCGEVLLYFIWIATRKK